MSGAALAAGAEDTLGTSFVERLPVERARQAFLAWKAAHQQAAASDGLPQLTDFAPHRLPWETVPWLLVYRERPDGELVYRIAGEELTFLFGHNPKGELVLAYAAPEVRSHRLAAIREAMQAGRPAWFSGFLLFENRQTVSVGRLALPTRIGEDRALLLIYFILGELPANRPRLVAPVISETDTVMWSTAADLAAR